MVKVHLDRGKIDPSKPETKGSPTTRHQWALEGLASHRIWLNRRARLRIRLLPRAASRCCNRRELTIWTGTRDGMAARPLSQRWARACHASRLVWRWLAGLRYFHNIANSLRLLTTRTIALKQLSSNSSAPSPRFGARKCWTQTKSFCIVNVWSPSQHHRDSRISQATVSNACASAWSNSKRT